MNANFAFQILQLANTHNEAGEDVVKRAMAYRDFILDRDGEQPVTEPVARRKRRTKAEMAQGSIDIPDQVPVSYEEIQQAILRLLDRRGAESVATILIAMGAKTALDLKPEQYRYCLDMMQSALEGPPLD